MRFIPLPVTITFYGFLLITWYIVGLLVEQRAAVYSTGAHCATVTYPAKNNKDILLIFHKRALERVIGNWRYQLINKMKLTLSQDEINRPDKGYHVYTVSIFLVIQGQLNFFRQYFV